MAADIDAAEIIEEKDLSSEILAQKINCLFGDNERIIEMGNNMKKLGHRDVTQKIIKSLELSC